MSRAKLILIGVVCVLTLIVFLQNTAMVETKFLFLTVAMPRVLLLAAVFVMGFAVGVLAAGHHLAKRKEAAKA